MTHSLLPKAIDKVKATSSPKAEAAPSLKLCGHTISRQRILGAYYTPDRVAEVLVRWALDEIPGKMLDPSFGGCAFMEAGAKILTELGIKDASEQVFGVDIDVSCVEHVRNSGTLRSENCIFEDFLTLSPESLPNSPFQAIVGNPPYVRHHWVKGARRKAARRIARKGSITLPRTASLWAYFVVHALAFLAPGGRLAFLVPEAILQADYASAIRLVLQENFRQVRLIHLHERLFDDTTESVVVLAGESFGSPGAIEVQSVETAAELAALLKGISLSRPDKVLANGRRVRPQTLGIMNRLQATSGFSKLSQLSTVRIGLVTGANSHFLRTTAELRHLGIPAKARSGIVSRTTFLSGLDFSKEDHNRVASAGAQAFLVRPTPSQEGTPGVTRWIRDGEAVGVHDNYKCQIREPWYRVDLPPIPDAFLTSTRLAPPLLVLNRTKLRCTNTLYAVYFKLPGGLQPESVALGFLTTFVALWAEMNGRRYGGGALKLDLKTLSELPIPLVPDPYQAFREANEALRNNNEPLARQIADRAVLEKGFQIPKQSIERMRRAHQELMQQRLPLRKK